jgi:hypothetical protein
MVPFSNGKGGILQLSSMWRTFGSTRTATPEIAYRLGKLSDRIDVVMDRIFIKTVKAYHLVCECWQLSGHLATDLDQDTGKVYRRLTEIERCVDDLVRKTNEFRVKAG